MTTITDTATRDANRSPELTAAYAHCRVIAKREAKNFYYGFLALPRHKSDAMCAVYAFMRRADDIADDESVPVPQRRTQLAAWLDSFQTGASIAPQDRPIFLAVHDVQFRFHISDSLLHELVAGTAMDLAEDVPEGVLRVPYEGRTLDVYTTLEALEHYCYLVASVVGLVTIRIFGYENTVTEAHAIAMGKAFQLTNILRDVKEDAQRGRIYLPLDLLEQHGSSIEDVMQAAESNQPSASLLNVLQQLASRAENHYGAQPSLIADLAPDSRGAMRTLVSIYQTLLHRIERKNFQVFSERIRVSTAQKLAILARGMMARFTQ